MGKLSFSKLDHTMELLKTFHNRQAHCSSKALKNVIAFSYGRGVLWVSAIYVFTPHTTVLMSKHFTLDLDLVALQHAIKMSSAMQQALMPKDIKNIKIHTHAHISIPYVTAQSFSCANLVTEM